MTLTVGTKYDQGKLRWDLVPPEFEEVVEVLTYGASKYDDRNWEKGIQYGRLIAAALRHIWSWVRGERNDPETGLHHLGHAGCDIMFLLTYELRGMKEFDDRSETLRQASGQPELPLGKPRVQSNLPTTSKFPPGRQLEGSNGVATSNPKTPF